MAENSYDFYGRYNNQISDDQKNIDTITDPNAKAAEQNWINEYKGGVYDNPSVRKGRISYDARREISLQNYYKNQLKKNATDNYNNFDPEAYAKGETEVARRNMASNVTNSQKTIRGNANASGMLFSGRRQMGEALVGQQADQDFQKYQQDLVSDALNKKQQLATAVTAPIAAQASADLNRQLQQQQLESAANQQQSQLAGAGLGLIGSGVGNYYGQKPPVNNTTGNQSYTGTIIK